VLQARGIWVTALTALLDERLAAGQDDGSVTLWNLASGKLEANLEGHTKRINALALLPDGRLASGSDDHTIRLWRVSPR
jgi:WD40 repeat protein